MRLAASALPNPGPPPRSVCSARNTNTEQADVATALRNRGHQLGMRQRQGYFPRWIFGRQRLRGGRRRGADGCPEPDRGPTEVLWQQEDEKCTKQRRPAP
ncbi:hypothetical protein NDU88_006168 [Pleurodeles waltl]|uniref:Uncharacterized protein n=1 Tax=Pleurodeles waltl TaxID=8319 RepID=A0AAV7UK84_PLEWA|nr:hypothetical protein NDU88_006168 [Pleurodeles waltl]